MGLLRGEDGTDGAECRRKVGSGRKVAGPWSLLGVCTLSVQGYCMNQCLCLFFCMVVIQRYEKRKRSQELGLCRWTTLEVCWVL